MKLALISAQIELPLTLSLLVVEAAWAEPQEWALVVAGQSKQQVQTHS